LWPVFASIKKEPASHKCRYLIDCSKFGWKDTSVTYSASLSVSCSAQDSAKRRNKIEIPHPGRTLICALAAPLDWLILQQIRRADLRQLVKYWRRARKVAA